MLSDLLEDEEFLKLPEEQQISKLRADDDDFSGAWSRDPEETLKWLRGHTGKKDDETSAVGEVIRQVGSGLGEFVTDVAQLPFEAAEWVASAAGSEWSTGVDEAIEAFQQETFPEPTTGAGRVGRLAGYGLAAGVATAGLGSGLGVLGAFAKAPGLIRAGGARSRC